MKRKKEGRMNIDRSRRNEPEKIGFISKVTTFRRTIETIIEPEDEDRYQQVQCIRDVEHNCVERNRKFGDIAVN